MKKNAGLQLGEVFVRGLILMKNTLILTIMIDIMIMIDILNTWLFASLKARSSLYIAGNHCIVPFL